MNDLISRQASIDALRVAYWDDNIQSAKDDPFIAYSEVTDCIYIVSGNKMYEVTDQVIEAMKNTGRLSERKKGEWITSFSYVKCSECGEPFIIRPNFCPDCGADMR